MDFPKFTYTDLGRNMSTRAASGNADDRLIVTKAVFGGGTFEGDITKLTALISPKLEATLTAFEDLKNGTCRFTFIYDNSTVDVGFEHREIGIYAKNGDSGTEQLLCYSNAGNRYSFMGDKSNPLPLQKFRAILTFGNTANVAAMIDVSNAITLEDLYAHNTGADSHELLLTDDTTSIDDSVINASEDIRKLWARVGWVVKYMEKKGGLYVPKAGGTVTGDLDIQGILSALTPPTGDNSTRVATTAWVLNRIAALATGPIVGDVSNPNAWWVKIPAVGFNLLIQGVVLYNVPIDSYWIFPVSFKTLFTVLGNDINDKDYTTSTQILTFSDYSPTKIKLGATTIDRRLTKFFGRLIAIGIV